MDKQSAFILDINSHYPHIPGHAVLPNHGGVCVPRRDEQRILGVYVMTLREIIQGVKVFSVLLRKQIGNYIEQQQCRKILEANDHFIDNSKSSGESSDKPLLYFYQENHLDRK